MALIPHALVDRFFEKQREQEQLVSDAPTVHLSALDTHLREVLANKMLPDDQKAKLYGQILDRYNSVRDQHLGHSPVPVANDPPPLSPNVNVCANLHSRYTNKARGLFDHLKQLPGMRWNEKNEMIYNDRVIPGSNLIDLVHTYVKPGRRGAAKPAGWHEFGQALLTNNVPRTLITNKHLWEEVEAPVPASPSPPPSPVAQRTTGRRFAAIRRPVAPKKPLIERGGINKRPAWRAF